MINNKNCIYRYKEVIKINCKVYFGFSDRHLFVYFLYILVNANPYFEMFTVFPKYHLLSNLRGLLNLFVHLLIYCIYIFFKYRVIKVLWI